MKDDIIKLNDSFIKISDKIINIDNPYTFSRDKEKYQNIYI